MWPFIWSHLFEVQFISDLTPHFQYVERETLQICSQAIAITTCPGIDTNNICFLLLCKRCDILSIVHHNCCIRLNIRPRITFFHSRGKTELKQLHDNFSAKIHTIQNKHARDVAPAKEKLARDLKSAQESMMDVESVHLLPEAVVTFILSGVRTLDRSCGLPEGADQGSLG